jgi:hypothetical protein
VRVDRDAAAQPQDPADETAPDERLQVGEDLQEHGIVLAAAALARQDGELRLEVQIGRLVVGRQKLPETRTFAWIEGGEVVASTIRVVMISESDSTIASQRVCFIVKFDRVVAPKQLGITILRRFHSNG